jgi:hypothetical protein
MPHVRICGGGYEQSSSLLRPLVIDRPGAFGEGFTISREGTQVNVLETEVLSADLRPVSFPVK